jgi:hypothetical protein
MWFFRALLLVAIAGCTQSQNQGKESKLNLNILEQCQRMDLQGKESFLFHVNGCIAEVHFDSMGQVKSFEPQEGKAEICQKVIEACSY